METERASAAKAFPAVRLDMNGITTHRNRQSNSGMFRSKNSSFLDNRGSEAGVSQTTATKAGRNFGFRNHSLALGSTVRHF